MSGCWCGRDDEDRLGGSLLEEGVKRREESLQGCAVPDTAPKTTPWKI